MTPRGKNLESKKDTELKLLVLRDELESLQESLDQVPSLGYRYFAGPALYKRVVELAFFVHEDKVREKELKEAGLIELSLLIQNLIDDLDWYFLKHFNERPFLSFRKPIAKLVVERLIEEQGISLEDWRGAKEKLLAILQKK